MKNNIIITTTNTIENVEIENYIELISTNVVVGTNIFSDIGASISDFFGGFSSTYQSKLQLIYKSAIDNLKQKAFEIGANAIIGLKVDFDEISGKGKSMFMISAIGTAVLISGKTIDERKQNNQESIIISNLELEQELTKKIILQKAANEMLFKKDEWIYLLQNPIGEISSYILDKYLEYVDENVFKDSPQSHVVDQTPKYFGLLDEKLAINTLYSKVIEYPTPILEILKSNNLFSKEKIIGLFKNNEFEIGAECLSVEKKFYTGKDLADMKEIIKLIDNLPDKGSIETVKNIRGTKEKYICPNSHKNNPEVKFCENSTCGLNIKGLRRNQVVAIRKFKDKIETLESLISKYS